MTHVVVAHWRAREGETAKVEAILRALAAEIRKEPGNVLFLVNRQLTDPNAFVLYEQYKDERSFLEHRQTAHFKTLVLEKAVPLLARRDIQTYSLVE